MTILVGSYVYVGIELPGEAVAILGRRAVRIVSSLEIGFSRRKETRSATTTAIPYLSYLVPHYTPSNLVRLLASYKCSIPGLSTRAMNFQWDTLYSIT